MREPESGRQTMESSPMKTARLFTVSVLFSLPFLSAQQPPGEAEHGGLISLLLSVRPMRILWTLPCSNFLCFLKNLTADKSGRMPFLFGASPGDSTSRPRERNPTAMNLKFPAGPFLSELDHRRLLPFLRPRDSDDMPPVLPMSSEPDGEHRVLTPMGFVSRQFLCTRFYPVRG